MPLIGAHVYNFHEVNYGGLNRGVQIVINGIGAANNTMNYRLGHNYNPHNLDINWYLNNINAFYLQLGTSLAVILENDPNQHFNAHINWPHAYNAFIHGHVYHAIREDLF